MDFVKMEAMTLEEMKALIAKLESAKREEAYNQLEPAIEQANAALGKVFSLARDAGLECVWDDGCSINPLEDSSLELLDLTGDTLSVFLYINPES